MSEPAARLHTIVSADISQATRALDSYINKLNQTARAAQSKVTQLGKATGVTQQHGQATSRASQAEQQLLNSQVRVAVASRDYAKALQLLDSRLSKLTPGTTQYNAVLAQKISLSNRAADAMKREATAASQQSSSLSRLGGDLLRAAAGYMALSTAVGAVAEGFRLMASMDQSRRTLGVILEDQTRANKVFADGIEFGKKYGFTQGEVAEALQNTSFTIRKTKSSTEELLSVLMRLAQLDPVQGLQGAGVALRELQSGDPVSLVRRFEMPRDMARAMANEIKEGGDAVKLLDKFLNDMGATNDLLASRMEGPNAQLVAMKQASEDAKLALAGLGGPLIVGALQVAADVLKDGAAALKILTSMGARNDQLSTSFLASAGTFEEYNKQVESANAQMPFYQTKIRALTEEQYNYARAIIMSSSAEERASGVAAQTAHEKARNLDQIASLIDKQKTIEETLLGTMTLGSAARAASTQATEEQKQTVSGLSDELIRLTEAGGTYAATAQTLTERFYDNYINSNIFTFSVQDQIMYLQEASGEMERASNLHALLAAQYEGSGQASNMFTQEIIDETDKKIADTIATAELAQANRVLGQVTDLARQGPLGMATALAILSVQFGKTGVEAQDLINKLLLVRRLTGAPDVNMSKMAGSAGDAIKNVQAVSEALNDQRYAAANTAGKINLLQQEIVNMQKRGLPLQDIIRKQTELDALRRQAANEAAAASKKGASAAAKAEKAQAKTEKDRLREIEEREKAEIDLLEEQGRLDEVLIKLREKLMKTSDETERLKLQKEILEIEEKIADEKERQVKAALDAKLAAIDDRKKKREEEREMQKARRVLSNPTASAAQKAAARDVLERIPLEQQKRQLGIMEKQRDAGGTGILPIVPTSPGSIAAPVGGIPAGVSGTASPGSTATGASGETGISSAILQGLQQARFELIIDGDAIAKPVILRLMSGHESSSRAGLNTRR